CRWTAQYSWGHASRSSFSACGPARAGLWLPSRVLRRRGGFASPPRGPVLLRAARVRRHRVVFVPLDGATARRRARCAVRFGLRRLLPWRAVLRPKRLLRFLLGLGSSRASRVSRARRACRAYAALGGVWPSPTP